MSNEKKNREGDVTEFKTGDLSVIRKRPIDNKNCQKSAIELSRMCRMVWSKHKLDNWITGKQITGSWRCRNIWHMAVNIIIRLRLKQMVMLLALHSTGMSFKLTASMLALQKLGILLFALSEFDLKTGQSLGRWILFWSESTTFLVCIHEDRPTSNDRALVVSSAFKNSLICTLKNVA